MGTRKRGNERAEYEVCRGLTMQIDTRFPLNKLNELARMESYNKHYYRPPNYLHKWWARRLGSVFRTIILGTFLEGDQDVWEAYYRRVDFGDKIVLDPFMGWGTYYVVP